MTTHAFLRVSTMEQDTEKNKIEILQFANKKKLGNVEFTEEHVSGRFNFRYRKLGALLDSMTAGDVLIVPELSRIARSITQIFDVIAITKEKGITLYSLKEKFDNTDESITSTVTSTVFALVAQIERELISIRTKEALYAKKVAGIKLGRPVGKGKSKLDPHRQEIMEMVSMRVPKKVIADRYNTSVSNLYNFLKSITQA